MCGPSGSEKALAASSSAFASLLQGNYGQLFSGMTDVLKSIGTAISPILSAGPSQRGFSGPQTAQMQTEAINTSAAAARASEQAARTYGAGQGGGGTSGLTSGIQQQIESGIASQQAQAEAGRLGQIEAADWQTGRENFWRAQGAEQQLAGVYGGAASGAQGGAISEGEQAFGEAKTITEQQNQEQAAIGGLIASAIPFAGKGIAGGLEGLQGTGGESVGGKAADFFSGFAGAFGG